MRACPITQPFKAPNVEITNAIEMNATPDFPRNVSAAFAATGAAVGKAVELDVVISFIGSA